MRIYFLILAAFALGACYVSNQSKRFITKKMM